MNLKALLEGMTKVEASDLHFKVGVAPILRINTILRSVDHPPVTSDDMMDVIDATMPERLRKEFEEEGACDFAYSLADIGRFRIAAYHQRGDISIAIRRVQITIPALSELNLPEAAQRQIKHNRGLILVTGVTGSGKSTTMASMLQEINNTRRRHIVTLEDPIEFLFVDNRSLVNQLEIGGDSVSFKKAMGRVVRFDPDIIMIGEMRNSETVLAAIEASDTGHLVLSTLHTSDAKQTINRILHFFPREEEENILEQLSLNLQAVISQRLLPRADIKALIPAVELLIVVPIVSKLIREGRIEEIQGALANREADMQSFDVSLALLVREAKISMETASQYCSDEATLRRMIRGESSAGDRGGLIGGL